MGRVQEPFRLQDSLILAQMRTDLSVEMAIAEICRWTREGEGRRDCRDCRGEIPHARLRYVPNAQRCAPCQERHERQEAVFASGRMANGSVGRFPDFGAVAVSK
jgi:RNA polymerase-binding transcription factor DksA